MTRIKRYFKQPEWTLIEDKTEYHWMRVSKNKIVIMYEKVKMKDGSVIWDGECTFDEDVCWEQLVEMGDTYVFPGGANEVIILDKNKLLRGQQTFHHWKHGMYCYKSWKDVLVYAKFKRYNIKNRVEVLRWKDIEIRKNVKP